MPRIPLLGGAYSQPSLIAGAQRSVNIYPEQNPQTAQSPTQVTHYPRPGLTPLGITPIIGAGRALYTAGNGDLYAVINQNIYYINPDFVWTQVGSLIQDALTPVYITDNGKDAIVVDGSAFGVDINLATRIAIAISDPNFLGADRATFLNFFMLFNQINSPNFYATLAASNQFNALSFGSLTESTGNCLAVQSSEAALWVFGPWKAEVWADAGAVPFAFQLLSGIIIEYGLAGHYAVGRQDKYVYWLSQSPEGGRMAMSGYQNTAQRISTHAIEHEWLGYTTVSDCVVQTYQCRGHMFVLFHFPTADRTWVFDQTTNEWHEEAYYDSNGIQHRTRDMMMTYAYGKNLSLDWQTGQLYQRDETNFSDNGIACVYIRGCPHISDDNDDRLTLWRVIADMECGNGTGVQVPTIGNPWSLGFNPGFGPSTLIEPTQVTLRISRDRGFSFTTHSIQPLGGTGQYTNRPTFNRCGQSSYDIVLELQWTGPMKTALNGVFASVEPHILDSAMIGS